MRVKIVGSAAGGGFPQWNCNYRLSRAARAGAAGMRPRTQSSLAASADGRGWVLFNASPDIRQQIAETPELQPAADAPLRSTPLRAVVLTNADVDHIAGLLSLRERQPFAIYATAQVLTVLESNSIFNVLDPAIVPRRRLPLHGELKICDADGGETGVTIESFSVPGKVALYLEESVRPEGVFTSGTGDTIGVRISGDRGGSVFYIPGCAADRCGFAPASRRRRLPAVRRHGLHRRRDDYRRRRQEDRGPHGTSCNVGRKPARSPALPASPSADASSSTSTTPTRFSTRTRPSMRPSAPRAGRWLSTGWRCRLERLPRRGQRRLVGERARSRAAAGRCRALSQPPPLPSPDDRRPAVQGRNAGMGAEPLLLSGGHSAQGRHDPGARRGSGLSRRLAQAHRGP